MDTMGIFSGHIKSLEAAFTVVCLTTADTQLWVKDSLGKLWGQVLG